MYLNFSVRSQSYKDTLTQILNHFHFAFCPSSCSPSTCHYLKIVFLKKSRVFLKWKIFQSKLFPACGPDIQLTFGGRTRQAARQILSLVFSCSKKRWWLFYFMPLMHSFHNKALQLAKLIESFSTVMTIVFNGN